MRRLDEDAHRCNYTLYNGTLFSKKIATSKHLIDLGRHVYAKLQGMEIRKNEICRQFLRNTDHA